MFMVKRLIQTEQQDVEIMISLNEHLMLQKVHKREGNRHFVATLSRLVLAFLFFKLQQMVIIQNFITHLL